MTWHSCMFRELDSGDDLLSYTGNLVSERSAVCLTRRTGPAPSDLRGIAPYHGSSSSPPK